MRNQIILVLTTSTFLVAISSCQKFLDEKPNDQQIVPETLENCRYLLDDYSRMNSGYPNSGEGASDNYFITDAQFAASPDFDGKNNYIWDPATLQDLQWSSPHRVVYTANLVLQTLKTIEEPGALYDELKGSALFFRAFAYHTLAQLFTMPYREQTAASLPGLPIRLTADLESKVDRINIKDTYDQILADLIEAESLLPISSLVASRPDKASARAALARTYLSMCRYDEAGIWADKAIELEGELIDYNSINSFSRLNKEVIFQATSLSYFNSLITPPNARVDTALYNSYDANDRRKTLFFQANTGVAAGTYRFKGSYDGPPGNALFVGLATNEMYLTRAESRARAGDLTGAMLDLNYLLRNRYEPGFSDLIASTANEALELILKERRKELIFRGLRWMDIRRLNNEPQFAITLTRPMNSIPYQPLIPGDKRFALLIPEVEIMLSGIEQNPR